MDFKQSLLGANWCQFHSSEYKFRFTECLVFTHAIWIVICCRSIVFDWISKIVSSIEEYISAPCLPESIDSSIGIPFFLNVVWPWIKISYQVMISRKTIKFSNWFFFAWMSWICDLDGICSDLVCILCFECFMCVCFLGCQKLPFNTSFSFIIT